MCKSKLRYDYDENSDEYEEMECNTNKYEVEYMNQWEDYIKEHNLVSWKNQFVVWAEI